MNKKYRIFTIAFTIVYIGLMIETLSIDIIGGSSQVIDTLIQGIGELTMIVGVIYFFIKQLEKKIDANTQIVSKINSIGVQDINEISTKSIFELQNKILKSYKTAILISYQQVNKNLRFLLEQFDWKNVNSNINIIFCGIDSNMNKDDQLMKGIEFEQKAMSDLVSRLKHLELPNLSLRHTKNKIFHNIIFTDNTAHLTIVHETESNEGIFLTLDHNSELGKSYHRLFDFLWEKADEFDKKEG